jgi:hypothetical protein
MYFEVSAVCNGQCDNKRFTNTREKMAPNYFTLIFSNVCLLSYAITQIVSNLFLNRVIPRSLRKFRTQLRSN